MTPLKSLSVFLPAYNEVENIEPLVNDALRVLPCLASSYEVIIVNDGSTDGTAALADQLALRHPNVVQVVHHDPNRGYGGALKSGFAAARYEWIFFTDGDRQFHLSELPDFVKHLQPDLDMLIGYRLNRKDPFHRLLNAKLYSTMIRLMFRLRVRDIDCAYKLLHRRVYEAISLKSAGALISAEILIKARGQGFKWAQVGVNHYPRPAGSQSGANLRVVLRMFGELFHSYRELRKNSS